jgi:hypothetical protein
MFRDRVLVRVFAAPPWNKVIPYKSQGSYPGDVVRLLGVAQSTLYKSFETGSK